MSSEPPWWKSAVVYQIYPRSFLDTDGDGVGDLEGIGRGLDHLAWLGVDAIWLSPFFPSPMADFGYDVADYCDVDPLFGTLDDFDRLLAGCHERGIRVLIDWVPNHTSDRHPWFLEARSSRQAGRRDWYVWRDGPPPDGPGAPRRPPNDWRAAFDPDQPAWTWDESTRQWYLHLFLPEQPDLDWRNPAVVAAMHDVLRFWLDRGVDGFRADVVHAIGKDPDLVDVPPWSHAQPPEHDLTHELLRGVRALLDSYDDDRVMVGEVYILSTARVARYYGDDDELHLAFNFPPLYAPWTAEAWRRRVDRVVEELDSRQAWPTWVLSNHDNPRHRTRYGTEARARAAAVLLLTLRGTPFLYAGEELGLEDAVIRDHLRLDPGGRDGCRAPIPWDGSPGHGWAAAEAWLPWPPAAEARHAQALRADRGSILHLYRRLLAARRASPALRAGAFEWLEAPADALAWLRHHPDSGDRRAVAVNFTEAELTVPIAGDWLVEVAAGGAGEGAAFDGMLSPDAAVVLRPA